MIISDSKFKVSGVIQMISHKGNPDCPSVDTGRFSNLFTRHGLNSILGGSQGISRVNVRPVVGSGNSAPSITDTSLQSFVAGAANSAYAASTSRNSTISPYGVKHTIRWRFPQGSATGNISEVGLADIVGFAPTNSTPLITRALVKDASGDPTSITVLDDEFLDVIYEITISGGDFVSGTFNQTIDGSVVSTAYTIGPSSISIDTSPGWGACTTDGFPSIRPNASAAQDNTMAYVTSTLGPPSTTPSGTAYRIRGSSASAVNLTDSYCDFTYNAFLDDANISIGSMSLSMTGAAFKISLSPPVVKVASKTYRLTVRVSASNAS